MLSVVGVGHLNPVTFAPAAPTGVLATELEAMANLGGTGVMQRAGCALMPDGSGEAGGDGAAAVRSPPELALYDQRGAQPREDNPVRLHGVERNKR